MQRLPVPPVRNDGLQLREHVRFQRLFWKAERVAWGVFSIIAALVAAGAAGAGGPLSRASWQAAGVSADVPRIMRADRAEQLRISFLAGRAEIELSPGFGDVFRIEDVRPRPMSWRSDRHEVLGFGEGPVEVVLHVRSNGPAALQLPVAINGRPLETVAIILP